MSDNDFDVLNGKLDKILGLLSERSKEVITKEMGGEKENSILSDLGLNPRKSQDDRDREVDSKPPIVSEHVSGVNLEDKPNDNFVIPMKNAKFTWYRFVDQEGRVRKCKNEGCNLFLKYNEDKKKYEHWKFDPNTGKGGYVADKCEGIYGG